MERPSIRSWILALLLAACTKSSDSGSSGLAVRSISVPDFGRWECNRPIEFAFDQPIDFASVSTRSVRIRTQAGLPAVGTFTVKTIDADDDGEPERTVRGEQIHPESVAASGARFTRALRSLPASPSPSRCPG